MPQIVKSSALKIAMAMNPEANVRGSEIVGLSRYNFCPDLNCLEKTPDGRLLVLDFSLHDARTQNYIEGCEAVRERVAELPDDLIFGCALGQGR